MRVFFPVLVIAAFAATLECSEICVINESNTCSECEVTITANNISKYLEEDGKELNELTLTLCSDEVTLTDLILIQDKAFLFISSSATTTISCLGPNTGLKVVNVTDFTIEDVVFVGCRAEHNSTSFNTGNSNLLFNGSIYILNCSTVAVRDVHVTNSHGTGLAIFDSKSVSVVSCTFENNSVVSTEGSTTSSGGGGLYIELTYCTPGGLTEGICSENTGTLFNTRAHNTSCVIQDCVFRNNRADTVNSDAKTFFRTSGVHFQGIGRGGGLSIKLRGQASHNKFEIRGCKFIGNSAVWGGGLHISLHDSPLSNTISTQDSTFHSNICPLNGGGGVDVAFVFHSEEEPQRNMVTFTGCNFTHNTAKLGGGTLLLSSRSAKSDDLQNSITFYGCSWEGNKATIGSAVHANIGSGKKSKTSGFLTYLTFKTSNFRSNYIMPSANESVVGKGIFVSVGIGITFEGETTFDHNNGSALLLISSNAYFDRYSGVTFAHNQGTSGAAVMIIGQASLEISDNSSFVFTNNKAITKGGAIFQLSHSIFDYLGSTRCFIHYRGKNSLEERNIHFTFENNEAGYRGRYSNTSITYLGHSIYATTLRPCYAGCIDKRIKDLRETFSCIANFTFTNRVQYDISTVGVNLSSSMGTKALNVTPGESVALPIKLTDEMSSEVNSLYHLSVENTEGSNVTVSRDYISDRYIYIDGYAGDKAKITIKTINLNEVTYTLQVHLLECPPGYMHVVREFKGQERGICDCSATSDLQLYMGITSCEKKYFHAKMKLGYWLGYSGQQQLESEENLIMGYCPLGYCAYYSSSIYTLPNSTNKTELDRYLCGQKRTGRLCGQCRDGFSAYYHSLTYDCYNNLKCSIGWVFYILSDLLPITVFFLIVMLFSINFTTGAINGLIFYFQITDISRLTASGFIKCPSAFFSTSLHIYRFLTGVFNLNFFDLEKMSFCLWHGAQTLDLVAFKYVTIVYSLLLVIFIVILLRINTVKRLTQKLPAYLYQETNVKATVVHGLSGFLILCYSECTKISLILLTPATIHANNNRINNTAVFYNGEMGYFDGQHLLYALPALFFLIVIGVIPPVLLISYPFCYRVFGVLKISESRFVKLLCKCLPLEKLKPLFDSFQSSFKDNYRFFSGLYFMYRLLPLLAFSVARSLTNYYATVIIQFAIILCLHSVMQPYKKRLHNVLDALIFTNLLIVNVLFFYIYRRALELKDNSYVINFACGLQTTLLFLPLLLAVTVGLYYCYHKGRACIKCSNRSNHKEQNVELSESLLFSRAEETTNPSQY